MPAAAVIPAPIVYIRVVAVKKLVVELWAWEVVLRSLWFRVAGVLCLFLPTTGGGRCAGATVVRGYLGGRAKGLLL